MRRCLVVICLVAGSLLALGGRASACSVGPAFAPYEVTQLLIAGRVRSLELGGRSKASVAPFVDAIVTVDVAWTYRGAAGPVVRFVDHASASPERDPRIGTTVTRYAGGSGMCGTIDEDPVGKYVLIALARGDDGRWHANRLFGALYSRDPYGVSHRWLLERHGVPVPFLIVDRGVREVSREAALAP